MPLRGQIFLLLLFVPCWILMHGYLVAISPILAIRSIRVLMSLPYFGTFFMTIPLAIPIPFYLSVMVRLTKKYPEYADWMIFPLIALVPMYLVGIHQVIAGYNDRELIRR